MPLEFYKNAQDRGFYSVLRGFLIIDKAFNLVRIFLINNFAISVRLKIKFYKTWMII